MSLIHCSTTFKYVLPFSNPRPIYNVRILGQNTWAPQGAYTAEVLYNISSGWVTHDEVSASHFEDYTFEHFSLR